MIKNNAYPRFLAFSLHFSWKYNFFFLYILWHDFGVSLFFDFVTSWFLESRPAVDWRICCSAQSAGSFFSKCRQSAEGGAWTNVTTSTFFHTLVRNRYTVPGRDRYTVGRWAVPAGRDHYECWQDQETNTDGLWRLSQDGWSQKIEMREVMTM